MRRSARILFLLLVASIGSCATAAAATLTEIGIAARSVMRKDSDTKLPFGVYVRDVVSDSAAEDAGLEQGDVIISLGGRPITDIEMLKKALEVYEIGEYFVLGRIRAGGAIEDTVTVTVTKRMAEKTVERRRCDKHGRHCQVRTHKAQHYHRHWYRSARTFRAPEKLCESDKCSVMKIYYGTDRDGTDDDSIGREYGTEMQAGNKVEYGACYVTVPKDHVEGSLDEKKSYEIYENPNKHMILVRVEVKPPEAYHNELAKSLAAASKKSAFVYIHGYWNTFEYAAKRTAQMHYDLKFQGVPMFFSWPSKGSFLPYHDDETSVFNAAAHVKAYLADVAQQDVENIFVIAHSMGNRAMLDAVTSLQKDDPKFSAKLREVVLLAPDVDAAEFKTKFAPSFTGIPDTTLYASSNDWALWASSYFNKAKRLGQGGDELTVLKGISTIDVSAVKMDVFGHAAVEASSVIGDITELLKGTNKPDERPHLQARTRNGLPYWFIPPTAH
jgi:esterase/lipase superfamily enzyme